MGGMTDALKVVVEAIERLACDAPRQIAYLDSLGPGIEPDELALELSDDALSAARRAVEAGELPRAVRDGLLALDARFARMSGPQAAAFWTRAALADNPEWEAIRQQARALLDEIAADAACGQHVVSMRGSQ